MNRFGLLLLLLVGFSGIFDPALRKGRKGNAHFERQEYAQAAMAYRQGLRQAEGSEAWVRAGLYNNLGAALYRQKEVEEAYRQFQQALQEAPEPALQARAAYNAGNAAYRLKLAEEALRYYREALLRNPADEQARFNYEFVKRKLQEQQKQSSGAQQQPEPQDDHQEQRNRGGRGGQENEQDRQQAPQPTASGSQPEEQQAQGNEGPPRQAQGSAEQRQQGDHQGKLTREQALRLLQALEGDEKEVLRQLQRMKVKPRKTKKDW